MPVPTIDSSPLDPAAQTAGAAARSAQQSGSGGAADLFSSLVADLTVNVGTGSATINGAKDILTTDRPQEAEPEARPEDDRRDSQALDRDRPAERDQVDDDPYDPDDHRVDANEQPRARDEGGDDAPP